MNDSTQAVVIYGNPVDGFNHVGPFPDAEVANWWADGLMDGDWWVTSLTPPEDVAEDLDDPFNRLNRGV